MDRKLTYRAWMPVLLPVLLAAACMLRSCSLNDEWDDYYHNPPATSGLTVLDLIGDQPEFSSFYQALVTYGFEDLLSKNQYFTLFVPSNQAFSGLPEYTDSQWEDIIGFHIIYSNLYSGDFEDMELLTLINKYLSMHGASDGRYSLSGSNIQMDNVDNVCKNGVIHEIDKLLIPKPNVYEYIMDQDTSYSIIQDFLLSMDERKIDYENSERIGVDDNGDAVYDTVWLKENYFLDNIAGLDNETGRFTAFLPRNNDVRDALNSVVDYFGEVDQMDAETYSQLLFITFSGSFANQAYTAANLPDTIVTSTGNKVDRNILEFSEVDRTVSNGYIHHLSAMSIPKSFFLLPITIECDRKDNRTVSNTIYEIEQRSDSRASNGSFVYYGCEFEGDYLEYSVDMVLKTTYWIVWTGPKQGPSHYQISVMDELSGEFVNVGPKVDNWRKGNFTPVVSGTHTFQEFGTKRVRITIVDELPILGLNSIFVDYIRLIPDEIYVP